MKKIKIYLSLGGNEGKSLLCLQQALALLSCQPAVASLKFSHFYHTAPVQVETFHWFVNAVCSFETSATPHEIFQMTQRIEKQLGKIPKPKNASRLIDIDILFYGHQMLQEEDLEIPHPRWKERLFVLIPLADLTSEMILQGKIGLECYGLKDCIQSLLLHSSQAISLLEKNPDLQ